jgi:hypothetical protein
LRGSAGRTRSTHRPQSAPPADRRRVARRVADKRHGSLPWGFKEHLVELRVPALASHEHLALLHVPHHDPCDPRVAAEQFPYRPQIGGGERLGQLARTALPPGKLALTAGLERDRADADGIAAA